MAYIKLNHRELEASRAHEEGIISSPIASTLDGLLLLAARGELAYFTKDGLRPMDDYTRENCAIAHNAISQHFTIKILSLDEDPMVAIENEGEEAIDNEPIAEEPTTYLSEYLDKLEELVLEGEPEDDEDEDDDDSDDEEPDDIVNNPKNFIDDEVDTNVIVQKIKTGEYLYRQITRAVTNEKKGYYTWVFTPNINDAYHFPSVENAEEKIHRWLLGDLSEFRISGSARGNR